MINCKEIREKYTKLNTKEFAKAIGINYPTYRHYELDRQPTVETIVNIAKYLKLPIDVLTGTTQQYTPKQQKVIALVLQLNDENLTKIEERATILFEMQQ